MIQKYTLTWNIIINQYNSEAKNIYYLIQCWNIFNGTLWFSINIDSLNQLPEMFPGLITVEGSPAIYKHRLDAGMPQFLAPGLMYTLKEIN